MLDKKYKNIVKNYQIVKNNHSFKQKIIFCLKYVKYY